MKEGEEESKNTEAEPPLFPRLHVKDRETRGPRAPPRNKMALYEQFGITSQKFNSSAASQVSMPPDKASTLSISVSFSQDHQQEGSALPSCDVPSQRSIHVDKRVRFQSLDNVGLNSTGIGIFGPSKKQAVDCTFNAKGSASASVHPSGSSNAAKSHHKDHDDPDFMGPIFVQPENVSSNKDISERSTAQCAGNPERSISSSSSGASDKWSRGTHLNRVRLKNTEQKHVDQRQTAASVNMDPERIPDSGKRFAKTSNFATISSVPDSTYMATVAIASSCDNADVHEKNCSDSAPKGASCYIGIDIVNERENSIAREESYFGISLRSMQTAPTEVDGLQQCEHTAIWSPNLGDMHNNEVSESLSPNSISSMEICPDDVVEVIGSKLFWKARRAMVNQQRTFAIQVFELHRLIEVQKLLASSPDIVEFDFYLSESPSKVPAAVLPHEHTETSPEPTVIKDNSSQKPNEIREFPVADMRQDLPASQNPENRSWQPALAPDNRTNTWMSHPGQSQWLVPVISPSEGLIYKPYMGPRPSTAGFMAHLYEGYPPPSLSFQAVRVDFMNPFYHSFSSHQQPAQFYSHSLNGLPIVKPIMPSAPIQRVGSLVGLHPNMQELQQQPKRSCYVWNPRSEVVSDPRESSQTPRCRELQSSALTSFHEVDAQTKAKDALALLPGSQITNVDNQTLLLESADEDKRNRVIRVVPHRARLASESAARIFRSIQEERRHVDL